MIDAMINDSDIVVMKQLKARNGELVAIWLRGRDRHTEVFLPRERACACIRQPPP
jgi:SOS-response transcriptional repressor LexA